MSEDDYGDATQANGPQADGIETGFIEGQEGGLLESGAPESEPSEIGASEIGESHSESAGSERDARELESRLEAPEENEFSLVLQEQSIALELPVWEPTGDPEVDAALEALSQLNERSLADHASIFDDVYRRLHGRLSSLASGSS